jgi:hypothetical protein
MYYYYYYYYYHHFRSRFHKWARVCDIWLISLNMKISSSICSPANNIILFIFMVE